MVWKDVKRNWEVKMGSCVETDFLWKSLNMLLKAQYRQALIAIPLKPSPQTRAPRGAQGHTRTHTHTLLSADGLGPKNLAVCMAHGRA